ncbi:MAG: lipopolysaccharide biosynthesis protein [Gammaproteobacteria bacterium]
MSTINVRGSMARGAVWMVLFKMLERSLGLISMLVLARLLAPEDFGLVAMATSLIALLELFALFGMDTALIQRADATPEHFNTAWTLNVMAAGGIALMMLILAWPAGLFYHEPRVVPVICVLACGAMFQGLENVGVVMFRKNMEFHREFRFLLTKKVMAFAVVIPLAYTLRNYWALVIGTVTGRAGGLALSYAMHAFRPKFSLSRVRELMHVSKWLLTQNLITFLRDRSSDFVIGRIAGPRPLGIFSVSAEISSMPGTELVAPINRAILPGYVRLAHDMPALRREYLSVMAMIALVAVPAVAGFAVCAPFLVLVVLGPKWIDAAILIQILAFFGITQVLQSNAYSAFLAIGKPQVFVKINGIHVAILLPALVGLTYAFGITGAAWAYVGTALVILPVNFYFITRHLGLRPMEFISHLWRPLCAATVMYLGVRLIGPTPPVVVLPTVRSLVSLFECIALGVPIYIASATVLWLLAGRPPESAESMLLRKMPEMAARLRAKLPFARR